MRATSVGSRTAIAAATLSGLATAFDASAKTNVVTYWGQGPNQASLQTVCANPNIDIVNIAFVNVFPDQGAAGWPGTNFGNACGSGTYTYDGTSTQLLSNCPDIGPDIDICQKIYGTKVFLSIGGGYPTDYYLDSDASAANFAKFLWGAFGPAEEDWTSTGGPRPFGNAVVDGFDFDIESDMSAAPVVNGVTLSDYKTRGYATMISTFKNTLFADDTSKSYYISGAPQCVVPDAHFATVVSAAHFDFLFVQYYNTPECSARQALSASSKRAGTGFTGYDNWESVDSFNADVKLYMGLPASTAASSEASYYLEPSEVQTLVGEIYSTSRFGGIMLWEATYAADNVICHKDYATWMKQILTAAAAGTTVDATTSPCPAQTISKDGTCGGYNGQTCVGSIFGNCCSNLGYCGDSAEYCSISTCDTKGGECGTQYIVNATSTSSASSTTANSTSISASSASVVNSTSVSASASATAAYGTGAALDFANAIINGTGTYPKVNGTGTYPTMTAGPFANSSANAFGAFANAANAVAASTIYETSTVYDTITKTLSYSASQGGDPTTIVTEIITAYTTVYPVSTTTPTTSAANFNSGYNTGSKSDPKAADAAAAAAKDVYVTKTIYSTEYFTVTSSGAASGPATMTLTSSYAISTTVVSADPTSTAKAAKEVYVTKTLYSTEYFTVTSSGAASGPTTVTLTTTYAISTTVVKTAQKADPTTSATTTITLHSTLTDFTTVSATSTTAAAAAGVNINAADARPFAFTNSSSVAPFALANATVTRMITATMVPLPVTSVLSSSSSAVAAAINIDAVNALNATTASGASASAAASIETETIESIIPITTVVDGVAAPSGFVGTGVYAAKAISTFHPKEAAALTGSGDQSRVDIGVVVLALCVGAFFAL